MVDRLRSPDLEPHQEQRVVIIMGSESDIEHCRPMFGLLTDFGVNFEARVASAHKTPEHLLKIINDYNEQTDIQTVFIAVAGRSNALGGFIDFQTVSPVISSPPYSDKFGGADIYSSLRMPSGSAAVTGIEAEMVALHAIKILALNNPELADKILAKQREAQEKVTKADSDLLNT